MPEIEPTTSEFIPRFTATNPLTRWRTIFMLLDNPQFGNLVRRKNRQSEIRKKLVLYELATPVSTRELFSELNKASKSELDHRSDIYFPRATRFMKNEIAHI